MDSFALNSAVMQAVCDSTERVVAGVQSTQLSQPTPCSEWNVHDVMNHLLATLQLGAALLTDTPPPAGSGPGALPPDDLVGDDAVGAFRQRVAPLVAATTDEAVGRMHDTPLGTMPGIGLAFFTALDIYVHGWDLAKGSGQAIDLDASLAEPLLAMAHQMIPDEMRSPRIAPAVAVSPDADGVSRLVAFMGRMP